MKMPFKEGNILLPKNVDMTKWSVIACDQYTSDPAYWKEVETLVGEKPSTLKITLPEIYLENDVEKRIATINKNMEELVKGNNFIEYPNSLIYLERKQSDGRIREGIVGVLDLEDYDFNKGSKSLIRATEKTVVDRIPPRVKVREKALLELPHIMVLIDDENKSIIEPLKNKVSDKDVLYDFDLMKNGGHVKGYLLNNNLIEKTKKGLLNLCDKDYYQKKYGSNDILLFAMGDGNHSLATAKTCYENLKKTMAKEEYLNHPARYALVEVVNLYSEALEFEAIHRVLFNVNEEDLFKNLEDYYDISFEPVEGQKIEYVTPNKSGYFWIKNPKSNIPVGSLQMFLDEYLSKNNIKIDYVHGDEETKSLGMKEGNMAFLFEAMNKNDLFKTVIMDGALPRKTFSMGHSDDKRFYLEARKIR